MVKMGLETKEATRKTRAPLKKKNWQTSFEKPVVMLKEILKFLYGIQRDDSNKYFKRRSTFLKDMQIIDVIIKFVVGVN
jgi:hypothetical protein